MKWLIEAVLGAIVGPIINNVRAWVEGKEARKQLVLTGALEGQVASQQAQINGLKMVAKIYAETDPALGDMLVDLGLQLRSDNNGDQGGSDVRPAKDKAGAGDSGVPGESLR